MYGELAVAAQAVSKSLNRTRPASKKTYTQYSQYALESLYRFQTSRQTVADYSQLEDELDLAECEQN